MGFDMSRINSNIGASIDQMGQSIASQSSGSGELTEVQLLDLQQSINKWNMMVNMQSNIQKSWSEALKAVVQNMR